LHNAELEAELLMLLIGCWLRWPGDCSWSRLMALLLGRLLGVLAVHWGSLNGVCCSVKPDDLAGSHLSLCRLAPIASYIATCRTCYANTRTALLELYLQTDLCRLANWSSCLANCTSYIVSGWCRNSPRRVTWFLAVSVLA
jgi:hypothetical protein